ncbi:MAG TPA: chemotaxis protein CheC [Myxococcota bacterium]|jgi:chemotaxis protein CheC|nr:chemotaxis protein CheC [Myxococcota bacterium]
MMPPTSATMRSRDAARDRLRELGGIGAGHAANSLARLLGRTVRMHPPHFASCRRAVGALPLARFDLGVFFEIDGGPGGTLAVLFPGASRDALLRTLLGDVACDEKEGAPPDLREAHAALAESALREVGNILASSVVSAIADTLGARILPSLPDLVLAGAGRRLDALARQRGDEGAVCVETEIFDDTGELQGLVALLPASD